MDNRSTAIVSRRSGKNADKALSREDRYFLRTREVHPLLEQWEKSDPESYRLYLVNRDFMLGSDDIDLTDLEVHEVAIGLVLENRFHIRSSRDGITEFDMNQDQLRALDIVRKFKDTSMKMVRDSRRSVSEQSTLSSLRTILQERDDKVQRIKIREIDFKSEAKAILVKDIECEEVE